jgi:hypothetical protein
MARRKNITPVRRYLTLAGIAIAGLALLYLAVPRTIGAFQMLPGNRTILEIARGGDADRESLEVLAASRRRAAGWLESGRLWSDLAAAELLIAESGDAGADPGRADQDSIRRAAAALRTSLRLAPASPHAWTRLAYAEMLLHDGPTDAAAAALAMSMLTGRYEPDLMFARLELCFLAWPNFAVADRELVLDQVALAWRKSPKRLLDAALATGGAGILRGAFAGDPAILTDLERRLAKRAG